MPRIEWLAQCWQNSTASLSVVQIQEGWQILERHYLKSWVAQGGLKRPLGVEGRIAGRLVIVMVEFQISGRDDLLELADDGLHPD
jgi:hypothetical protein